MSEREARGRHGKTGPSARTELNPGHGAHASTYVACKVSTRPVSQRPMSWLKAAAFQNLRAVHGGMGVHVHGSGHLFGTQPHVECGQDAPVPTRAARAPGRESAGGSRREQRWRATYVSRMLTTRAVSQSARLLLKSAAPRNRYSVVFARDTFHLPARRQRACAGGYKQGCAPPARSANHNACLVRRGVRLLARCLRSSLAPKDPPSTHPRVNNNTLN